MSFKKTINEFCPHCGARAATDKGNGTIHVHGHSCRPLPGRPGNPAHAANKRDVVWVPGTAEQTEAERLYTRVEAAEQCIDRGANLLQADHFSTARNAISSIGRCDGDADMAALLVASAITEAVKAETSKLRAALDNLRAHVEDAWDETDIDGNYKTGSFKAAIQQADIVLGVSAD